MMNKRGQILPVVMVTLVVLTIIIAGLISWIQNDSRNSVKEQKSTSAENLAEAGIDRGTWKLQSSTSTWATAVAGTVITGYNFDTTYTDIPGGSYRIKFATGSLVNGLSTISITAEGRDSLNRELRAINTVVEDQTVYSAISVRRQRQLGTRS